MVLRRKVFNLFLMLICLFAVLGLASCGGGNNSQSNNNNNNNNNQPVVPSPEPAPEPAYEKLSTTEKILFNYFVEFQLPYFKDPSSASFVKAGTMCDNKIALYTVSGNNSYGNKVSTEYIIVIEKISDTSKYLNVDAENLSKYDSSIDQYYGGELESTISVKNPNFSSTFVRIYLQNNSNLSTLSTANLNKALNEYKVSQGW